MSKPIYFADKSSVSDCFRDLFFKQKLCDFKIKIDG
jgi:hypothetical protein